MIANSVALVIAGFSLLARPTAGQAPADKAVRAADGHPNLSGVWEALNTANWDIQAHAARPASVLQPGVLRGVAVPAAPVLALGAVGGVPAGLGVVEGDEIPYQPAAAARKKENQENWLARDPEVKCFLPGVPRATYMPYPFQIIQGTQRIMMAYEFASASRTIYLDNPGQSPTDTWMGRSVGHWENDQLVVDVTGFNDQTWFDRAGNFHSDALHVVERYTPLTPNHLDYEVTVDDPKVFSRPWKMRMPLYRRLEKDVQPLEYNCVEFVEELMYGHLRKTQLVRHWEEDLGERGGKVIIDVTRKASQ